eukprot:12918011-Alexandrium_andersonii.AAC.1
MLASLILTLRANWKHFCAPEQVGAVRRVGTSPPSDHWGRLNKAGNNRPGPTRRTNRTQGQ